MQNKGGHKNSFPTLYSICSILAESLSYGLWLDVGWTCCRLVTLSYHSFRIVTINIRLLLDVYGL